MLAAAAILVKAVLVALLLRVAKTDFDTQKILNRDVLAVAILGMLGLVLGAVADPGLLLDLNPQRFGPYANIWVAGLAAAIIFAVLLPLWLTRKLGAGDVKLMAAAPLVAGANGLFAFTVLLLGFTLLTALIIKNPLLLPEAAFRRHLTLLSENRLVPYGVPISFSLIGVILWQAFSAI